jgi:hypothetical protein
MLLADFLFMYSGIFLFPSNLIEGKEGELLTFLNSSNLIEGKEGELLTFLNSSNLIEVLPSQPGVFLTSSSGLFRESERINILGKAGDIQIQIVEKIKEVGIMGIDAVSDVATIAVRFTPAFPQQEVIIFDPPTSQILGDKNTISANWWLNLNTFNVSTSFQTLPTLNIHPPPPTATWQDLLDYQFQLLDQPRIDFEIKFRLKGDTTGRYESTLVRLSGFNSLYGKINYNLMPYLTEIAALGISKNHQIIFSVKDAGYGLLKTIGTKTDELSILASGLLESNWATTSDDKLIQII